MLAVPKVKPKFKFQAYPKFGPQIVDFYYFSRFKIYAEVSKSTGGVQWLAFFNWVNEPLYSLIT